ncbi:MULTISPECIES: helix-turn-helix domain-containing protein [Kordiimonas]|uniref:helix-turn-helix domain-containing protein n=1 Tax=Kordiimonas TaxID=288021 RepID=UPI00258096FB|nr:AraC family transcriptional regulator [Kordiimonas sp. UBA4487]
MRGNGWTRFHFRTDAETSLSFDSLGKVKQAGPLCQIFHHPSDLENEESIEAGSKLDWITVFIPPEKLGLDYGFDDAAVTEPVRELARGCDDLFLKNWRLRPSMQAIFDQIHNFPVTPQMERTFTEAKAIELICRMAKLVTQRDLSDLPPMVKEKDIPRLELARDILLANYCNPPSVEGLARAVGVNRNKLSYGFKYLYDATISEFCNELKLQAALQMLEDGTQSISEIAYTLGYGQVAAFSTAFRRRFNASPRDVRTSFIG